MEKFEYEGFWWLPKYPEMKKLISEIEKRRIGEILIEKEKEENIIDRGDW